LLYNAMLAVLSYIVARTSYYLMTDDQDALLYPVLHQIAELHFFMVLVQQ